jgi:hypothetical protein
MEKVQLLDDTIFVIRDFFSSQECAASIERAEASGFTDAPISTSVGFVLRKDVRDNDRVIVDDTQLAARLFESARPFLPGEWFYWRLAGLNERFRFHRYDLGQRFAPHTDGYFERDNGERSQFTFMVYLNDDFLGGTTNFYLRRTPLRVVPEIGMALVFAHKQLHEGTPVEKGRKYVLRTDVMYQPMRD